MAALDMQADVIVMATHGRTGVQRAVICRVGGLPPSPPGPYDSVGQTYAHMCAWAVAHGLQPTQDMWEAYLTDREREPDPSQWRTGLFSPCRVMLSKARDWLAVTQGHG
jgi:hypothetical protein